jgi:WD40 repeat protein
MKENRSEISNQVPSKPITSGVLSGKIFKFKKNT